MKFEIYPPLYLRKVSVKYQIDKIHGWDFKGYKSSMVNMAACYTE